MQQSNMSKIKLVPNQKAVTVYKEPCDNTVKEHYYAKINLDALSQAALDLDAGAFKLWVYFAKNQPGYQFALSKADVMEHFGIKKTQYDNAIKELKEKGYLVENKNPYYSFHEVPVTLKPDNEPPKSEANEQSLPSFQTTTLLQNQTTTWSGFNTRNIINTTENITVGAAPQTPSSAAEPPPRQEEQVRVFEIEAPMCTPKPPARQDKKELFKF